MIGSVVDCKRILFSHEFKPAAGNPVCATSAYCTHVGAVTFDIFLYSIISLDYIFKISVPVGNNNADYYGAVVCDTDHHAIFIFQGIQTGRFTIVNAFK